VEFHVLNKFGYSYQSKVYTPCNKWHTDIHTSRCWPTRSQDSAVNSNNTTALLVSAHTAGSTMKMFITVIR